MMRFMQGLIFVHLRVLFFSRTSPLSAVWPAEISNVGRLTVWVLTSQVTCRGGLIISIFFPGVLAKNYPPLTGDQLGLMQRASKVLLRVVGIRRSNNRLSLASWPPQKNCFELRWICPPMCRRDWRRLMTDAQCLLARHGRWPMTNPSGDLQSPGRVYFVNQLRQVISS